MKDIIKIFPSALAFLEWASNAPCAWTVELGSREEGSESTEWTGTASYEEAYQLARYGWKDGAQELTRQVATLLPGSALYTSRTRLDIAGFYPDVGRAVTGEMFSMVTPYWPDRDEKRVVWLRYNMSVVSRVDPRAIMTYGAALLSYIQELELKRFPVRLDVCEESAATRGKNMRVSFQFTLKQPGERLSSASLAFWLGHPSALRRIALSALERLPVQGAFFPGYGRPIDFTESSPGVVRLCATHASGDRDIDLAQIRERHEAARAGAAASLRSASRATLG
jgi:hypothetical protein